jgi:hypothetical protein
LRAGVIVLCILAGLSAPQAWAQPIASDALQTGAPAPGQKVKDAKGATVGQVEKIINDADGRPRQVLVRVTRVLRVLPVDALTRSGDAYVTVLSRAELEALPPAE